MSFRNGFLTEDEIELFQLVRVTVLPGAYTLRELFADVWEYIRDKTNFGKRFRRSVETGHLSGVARSGRTITNHQVYTVRAA